MKQTMPQIGFICVRYFKSGRTSIMAAVVIPLLVLTSFVAHFNYRHLHLSSTNTVNEKCADLYDIIKCTSVDIRSSSSLKLDISVINASMPLHIQNFFRLHSLFSYKDFFPKYDENESNRMKALRLFCSSTQNREIVKRKRRKRKTSKVILYRDYDAFECGIAKTGNVALNSVSKTLKEDLDPIRLVLYFCKCPTLISKK